MRLYRCVPALMLLTLAGCGGAGYQPKEMAPAPTAGHDGEPFANVAVVNGQAFPDVYFQHYGVNPTIDTAEEAVSTFAIDVDTAAYSIARSYLDRGHLPPQAAPRVEEFVNRFDYRDVPPDTGAFALYAEAFPSPNRPGYHVLRIGVKAREIPVADRPPTQLVFVVDVSGSMNREDRLGLVKRALAMLVEQMGARDRVAVVGYGGGARLLLPPTSGADQSTVLAALESLVPRGATNAQEGLDLGYEVAAGMQAEREGVTRVVLCSDGVANSGITDADGIFGRIEQFAKQGIGLTAVGFGMGNYNDVLMEQLANRADGQYHYVDREAEAHRVFVQSLTGTLLTVAKDVKVQVEFHPAQVLRYRLLGYENRALRKQDFADDAVDAGELGAGHAATALYEVKLRPDFGGTFATLRLRYKQPEGGASDEVITPLDAGLVHRDLEAASPASRLALVAAAFAEKLRGAYWVRGVSYPALLSQIEALPREWRATEEVQELARLIDIAHTLDRRPDAFASEVPVAQMDFDHVPIVKR